MNWWRSRFLDTPPAPMKSAADARATKGHEQCVLDQVLSTFVIAEVFSNDMVRF